jgi:DNA-directed RNA polymerase subunit RPC12/RpoP
MVKKVKGTVRFRCQGCHKEYDGTDAYNAGWKCSCGCPIAADVEISIVEEPEYQMWTYTVPTSYDYSVTVSTETAEPDPEVHIFRCKDCGAEFGSDEDVLPKRCPFCPGDKLEIV